MARPARTNAEWFKHPAAFRNDRRVKAIRARYGPAGYGLLTMLLELLTDAEDTQLCLDEVEVELLAGDLGSTADEVLGLICLAEKVGLFARNEAGCLKCPQLDEWLAAVFEKRNRSRNDAEAAKLPQPVAETGVSVTETPQSRIEKSRVEESIEVLERAASAAAPPEKKIGELVEASLPRPEKPNVSAPHTEGAAADVPTRKPPAAKFQPPTQADILAYMQQQRPHNPAADVQRLAAKCFNHYAANGWRVGRNPMKSWTAACETFLVDLPKLAPGQPATLPVPPFRQPAPSQVSQRQSVAAAARAKLHGLP